MSSLGPLAGKTANYNFNLTNFNWLTWHDYEWENWQNADALFYLLLGFQNVRGVWQQNTSMIDGERWVDPDDGTMWECEISHTSGNGTFLEDRQANPTYWSSVTPAGGGDVLGPPSSTLGAVAAYANTAGTQLSDTTKLWTQLASMNEENIFVEPQTINNTDTLKAALNINGSGGGWSSIRMANLDLTANQQKFAQSVVDVGGVSVLRIGGLDDADALQGVGEIQIAHPGGASKGIKIGNPTGGFPGAGYINAQGLQVNGIDVLLNNAPQNDVTYGIKNGMWVPIPASGTGVGTVVWYAGDTPPAGIYPCDGTNPGNGNTSPWTDLYAYIGTKHGGSGANDWKVPDIKGRVIVGVGTADDGGDEQVARALAEKFGVSRKFMTTTELVDHFHMALHNVEAEDDNKNDIHPVAQRKTTTNPSAERYWASMDKGERADFDDLNDWVGITGKQRDRFDTPQEVLSREQASYTLYPGIVYEVQGGTGGGATSFDELTDTPNSKVGQDGLYLQVDENLDRIIYTSAPGGSVTNPPSAAGELWTHNGANNVALVAPTTNGHVLVAATGLPAKMQWGTVNSAGLSARAVTPPKMFSVEPWHLLGRNTGATGDVQEFKIDEAARKSTFLTDGGDDQTKLLLQDQANGSLWHGYLSDIRGYMAFGSTRTSSDNVLTGDLSLAVVDTLPGTPDANTIYFVRT